MIEGKPEVTPDAPAAPDTSAGKGKRKKVMKAFATRMRGKDRVYGGGGTFSYRDGGEVFRMVPGQVREVPEQVIKRANAHGSKVFVKPGSQVEGEPVGSGKEDDE